DFTRLRIGDVWNAARVAGRRRAAEAARSFAPRRRAASDVAAAGGLTRDGREDGRVGHSLAAPFSRRETAASPAALARLRRHRLGRTHHARRRHRPPARQTGPHYRALDAGNGRAAAGRLFEAALSAAVVARIARALVAGRLVVAGHAGMGTSRMGAGGRLAAAAAGRP